MGNNRTQIARPPKSTLKNIPTGKNYYDMYSYLHLPVYTDISYVSSLGKESPVKLERTEESPMHLSGNHVNICSANSFSIN